MPQTYTLDMHLIGRSPTMETLKANIQRVAKTNSNVLIQGESGTGKELVAASIHALSHRHQHAFIPVNCGAIPADLIESELFGHEKGAFTGAINRRAGRFEKAHQGTLFLDEIGDMPLSMQVKLLRVLQEKCFERVGSSDSINTDVRIIAATHRDLELAIEQDSFREDLYYRLNVFPIIIPSLKQRSEDIPLLIDHFRNNLQTRYQATIDFSQQTLNYLCSYRWPGNVRELINLLEYLIILYPNETITNDKLPPKYMSTSLLIGEDTINPEIPIIPTDLKQYLQEIEITVIQQTLMAHQGNITRAAKQLSLGRTTLLEKMRKYGIGEYKPQIATSVNS